MVLVSVVVPRLVSERTVRDGVTVGTHGKSRTVEDP